MSARNLPQNKKDTVASSQEEEQYIKQMQNKKISLQQEATYKLKSILQNCYQMEQMGNDINVNLKGQTEKLENIHDVSNNMKKILKKADETSKQMSSFWYSIGKKIKRVFIKENDDDFQQINKHKTQKLTNEGLNNQNFDNFIKCQNSTQENTNQTQNAQDLYLDEITNQIKKLKYASKGTNQQLTKQNHLINSLDKKTDENSNKINEINKRLVKKFF